MKNETEQQQVDRIGVLTGGGDSPGTNAAIRAIVRRAAEAGIETIGFQDGWLGLLEDRAQPLALRDVSGILHVGGTLLGTSRTNPFKRPGGPEKVVESYKRNRLGAFVAIGGDDTLGVAHRLKDYGLRMVGIPQTIDNDLWGTDYCIGFDSAIGAVTDALDRLHTTGYSHHRILILEVMGRDAGWIALFGGLAGGADVILVPERKFSIGDIQRRIEQRISIGKRFSIIVVAEGAVPEELGCQVARETKADEFGHVTLGGVSYYIADRLSKLTDLPVRVTTLAYLQRGGTPSPFDRILATRFGVKAVEFILEGRYDVMTGLQGNRVVPVPLAEALRGPKLVGQELITLAGLFY
ncbi:MAG: 6-phosphofructokinase [Candidatus Acetothermia bacterium]|nr:6-phosphofructokinase [Candidatus Acetothermia bacterium]MDH7505741.1 ATP-dependent 6-phosphofructokinase [Candidatus Acetothermia bacterium]